MERFADHSDAVGGDSDAPTTSYGQILKSSAWIGGSAVLTIGIGVVRTKAMAVMLGPSGYGLMALYGSIIDLAVAAAGMGIGNAGVRQIAESVASGDGSRIARTVVVLRLSAIALGIVGALLLVALSVPVSALTFGATDYAGAVALLGVAVFFRLLSAGQAALIQGMRRIRDLAVIGVAGALLGAIISVILVYYLREQGVALSLVAGAAMGFVISWWFARRVRIGFPAITRRELTQEAGSLLKLGFAFMLSGLLTMGAAYAVRAIVLQADGLDAAGYYSAAWTLGGLYVGIILQAMGADFYPRLVGVADNDGECNRLVNEQTLVSLLLATPGVAGTIVFAPLIIAIFYSQEFSQAVEILRWICLGIALRVVTWPMGFVIIAKNRKLLFIFAELAWTVANVGLTWFCVRAFGGPGAGMAFFGSYLFHLLLIYPIVRRLSGFRWSAQNVLTGVGALVVVGAAFVGSELLPNTVLILLGTPVVILSGVYALKTLVALIPWAQIPHSLRVVLVWLRMNPRAAGC